MLCDFFWITAFGGATQDDVFKILNGEGPLARVVFPTPGPWDHMGHPVRLVQRKARVAATVHRRPITTEEFLKVFLDLKLGYYCRVVGKLM